MEKELKINASTWSKDTYGLYDYEDVKTNEQKFYTQTKHYFVLNKSLGKIEMIMESEVREKQSPEYTFLLAIYPEGPLSQGRFVVENICTEGKVDDPKAKMWQVVRSVRTYSPKNPLGIRKEFMLTKGMLLKFGKLRYRVEDLRLPNLRLGNTKEEESTGLLTELQPTKIQSLGDCRFCFSSESTVENPIISPCACAGSAKGIHYNCLKFWLTTRLHETSNQFVHTYSWGSFDCEICKTVFPTHFNINNKTYWLAEVKSPEKDWYLRLETFPPEKGMAKTIHLLTPTTEKDAYKLGRGHEVELKTTESTVSRCHAVIKCGEDGFSIEDNGSKFGTLVLADSGKVVITPEESMAIQIGRTIFGFKVKERRQDRTVNAVNIRKSALMSKGTFHNECNDLLRKLKLRTRDPETTAITSNTTNLQ